MRCLLVADVAVPNEGMGMENIDLYLVKKQAKVQVVASKSSDKRRRQRLKPFCQAKRSKFA